MSARITCTFATLHLCSSRKAQFCKAVATSLIVITMPLLTFSICLMRVSPLAQAKLWKLMKSCNQRYAQDNLIKIILLYNRP